MRKLAARIGAAAIVLLSATGMTQVRNTSWLFAEATTAQGCTVFIKYDPNFQTEDSQRKRYRLSWAGTGCKKGQPVNGVGTLRTTRDGSFAHMEMGRMIDGVFDGSITTHYKVGGKPYNYVIAMGCGVFDTGQPYGDCTPRPRPLSAIPTAERTDLLASCRGQIAELAAASPATSIDETIKQVTKGWLMNHDVMTSDIQSVKYQIARLSKAIANEPTAGNVGFRRVGLCLYERRLGQLNKRR